MRKASGSRTSVRFDPRPGTPRTDVNLVLNIDLAPTFAALAGAAAPGAEGRNLLPLLTTPSTAWRHRLPGRAPPHEPAVLLRGTQRYGYVREVCDRRRGALPAGVGSGTSSSTVRPIRRKQALMTSMRARARLLCSPPPPGYVFP